MPDDEPTFLAGPGEPEVEEITLPAGAPEGVVVAAINAAKLIALVGLVIGMLIVLAGVVVLLLGVSGAVSWEVSALGGSSSLQTSSTGVVIAIVGLGVIFITRMNVRVEKTLKGSR